MFTCARTPYAPSPIPMPGYECISHSSWPGVCVWSLVHSACGTGALKSDTNDKFCLPGVRQRNELNLLRFTLPKAQSTDIISIRVLPACPGCLAEMLVDVFGKDGNFRARLPAACDVCGWEGKFCVWQLEIALVLVFAQLTPRERVEKEIFPKFINV